MKSCPELIWIQQKKNRRDPRRPQGDTGRCWQWTSHEGMENQNSGVMRGTYFKMITIGISRL